MTHIKKILDELEAIIKAKKTVFIHSHFRHDLSPELFKHTIELFKELVEAVNSYREIDEKWQEISFNNFGRNHKTFNRFKVEGGYVYEITYYNEKSDSVVSTGTCFVADVDLTRYQAHLRDAYNQGFKDGKDSRGDEYYKGYVEGQKNAKNNLNENS